MVNSPIERRRLQWEKKASVRVEVCREETVESSRRGWRSIIRNGWEVTRVYQEGMIAEEWIRLLLIQQLFNLGLIFEVEVGPEIVLGVRPLSPSGFGLCFQPHSKFSFLLRQAPSQMSQLECLLLC